MLSSAASSMATRPLKFAWGRAAITASIFVREAYGLFLKSGQSACPKKKPRRKK